MGVPTVPQGEGFGAAQQSPSILESFEETLALGRGDPADPVAAAVEAFKENGTVTNRLAEAILIRSKAVAQLREQVGLELPDTAAGKRNAVKEAIAKLAQMQPEIAEREATVQQKNNQLNIDNTHAITYNNSIYGGEQNERTASTGADQSRVSGVYESGGANAQGRREPGRAAVDSGLILLSPSSRNLLSQRGVVDVEMHESSADNAAFSAALSNARVADTKNGWAVTPKSMEELDGEGIRTFMDNNASTGFAIAQDGDIEAVFANKAAGAPKGSTKITIPLAIANGGTKLDCYGEGLVRLYSQYGFIPVARTTFNPEFANEGWTPDNGMPDIYFMMHNGDSADTVVKNYGTYPFPTKAELDALPLMEYDEAYAYRDNLLQEKANTGAQTNDSQTESVGAATAGNPSVGAADQNFTGRAAYQDLLTDENSQRDRPGDVRPVEVPKVDGTSTNKLTEAILIRSKAVAQPREQVGLEPPTTAAGKRNTVKEAIAKLAQQQAVDSADTVVQCGRLPLTFSDQTNCGSRAPAALVRTATGDSFAFSAAQKINVRLRQAVGGNSPPDCCT